MKDNDPTAILPPKIPMREALSINYMRTTSALSVPIPDPIPLTG